MIHPSIEEQLREAQRQLNRELLERLQVLARGLNDLELVVLLHEAKRVRDLELMTACQLELRSRVKTLPSVDLSKSTDSRSGGGNEP